MVLQYNNQIYFECILNFSFPKIESIDQYQKMKNIPLYLPIISIVDIHLFYFFGIIVP